MRPDRGETVDERVQQIRLLEHGIGAGLGDGLVELRVGIAGERDQADARMVLAQPRDGRDAVHERHVQVDHDRVRLELVGELDRVEPVRRGRDDGELGLVLDQRTQRFEERSVVVREQDANRGARCFPLIHPGSDVSLAAVSVQPAARRVALIGAPLDLGAGRRGVDMGPSAIRYAELAEHLASALGVATDDFGNVEAPVAEALGHDDERARYLPQILELCDRVAKLVERARRGGATPIVLGGDHSVALGSLVGMAAVHGPGGVVWVDAHGDLNTPDTSPSGNVHGMVLAAALGLGGEAFAYDGWTLPAIEAGRLALVGVRSLDEGERTLLRELNATVFTMSEVDRRGIEPCMREALEHASGGAFLHVSFDMDAVDPEVAPGVGTPVRGGLSYREAHLAMELVAESGLVDSLDVVEVNPILDRENATGKLAVELVASALGARIL
jgi:arginase